MQLLEVYGGSLAGECISPPEWLYCGTKIRMPTARYLTKSKFKLGMQCPTKLYYVDKRDTYGEQ